MAYQTCAVPGCVRETHRTRTGRGYSPYCNMHRHRAKRHGHPQQECIPVRALDRYRGMITENIKKNPDNPAWTVAARRWDAIVTWAEDTSGAYYTDGKPGHLPTVKVAGAVLRVAPAATADEVWKTVVALTLMREFEPGRFHSDDGFRFEVARHVRNLGSSAAGTRYVPELGKTKPVYRDPAPDTLRTFGQTLIEAFGPLGLRIAERVREGLAEEREKKAEWKTALAALR